MVATVCTLILTSKCVNEVEQDHVMVQVAEEKRKFPRFAAAAIQDVETSTLPWQTSASAHMHQPTEQLPEAGPSRSICADLRPLHRKHLYFCRTECCLVICIVLGPHAWHCTLMVFSLRVRLGCTVVCYATGHVLGIAVEHDITRLSRCGMHRKVVGTNYARSSFAEPFCACYSVKA